MKCTDCNRFVSFNCESDPDLEDSNIDVSSKEIAEDTVEVTVTVYAAIRLVNNCQECGKEMADARVELEGESIFTLPVKEGGYDEGDFEIEGEEATRSDYFQTKDRRGKTISNPRYRKHIYSATYTCVVIGPGGNRDNVELTGEISGSDFEDIQ